MADDFNSNVIALSYDNAGNLTDDGVYAYIYDAWNRLVKAQREADGDTTTIATYAYDGRNRRTQKVVEHCGIENWDNDGGNQTIHFYYDNRWRIVETRDASDQALRQWVWGTQYVDEPIFMDVNATPSAEDCCDADGCGIIEAQFNSRHFYHQDRNWNVVALTTYDNSYLGAVDGVISKRFRYLPYGAVTVIQGGTFADPVETGQVLGASRQGNPFFHQGLYYDAELDAYQNRYRAYLPQLQRFGQRDPLAHVLIALKSSCAPGGTDKPLFSILIDPPLDFSRKLVDLYTYLSAIPIASQDPTGLADDGCGSCFNPSVCGVCNASRAGATCTERSLGTATVFLTIASQQALPHRLAQYVSSPVDSHGFATDLASRAIIRFHGRRSRDKAVLEAFLVAPERRWQTQRRA